MKDAFDKTYYTTALHKAVGSDPLDMDQIIKAVEGGACLNQPLNSNGETPLIILGCNEEVEAVRYLLDRGALISTFYNTKDEVIRFIDACHRNEELRTLLTNHVEDESSAEARIITQFRKDLPYVHINIDGTSDYPKPPRLF